MNLIKALARIIVRLGADSVEKNPLLMPLTAPVSSNTTSAIFLCGENIQIMSGTIVSPDSRIGANTYIGFNCHVTRANIGNFVSIADGVLIGPGEHSLSEISTSSIFYEEPYSVLTKGECNVGDDVWIGAGCIIRRGVTIGFGAVIGANSFVNSDVPPFAVMAGTPAKLIKFRFDEEFQEKILRSQWTQLPLDLARDALAKLKTGCDFD